MSEAPQLFVSQAKGIVRAHYAGGLIGLGFLRRPL
jgi:hypothetical protein